MNTAIQLITNLIEAPALTVSLSLENEGQDANFMEKFTGTPFEAFQRAVAIVSGLRRLLPSGLWSVRIEEINNAVPFVEWDSVTVTEDGRLVDNMGELIARF